MTISQLISACVGLCQQAEIVTTYPIPASLGMSDLLEGIGISVQEMDSNIGSCISLGSPFHSFAIDTKN